MDKLVKKHYACAVFFFLIAFMVKGQENDAQVWYGAELKYEIIGVDIALAHQVRQGVSNNAIEKQFTNVNLEYNVWKSLSVGTQYRFGRDKKKSGYFDFSRLAAFLKYKLPVNRFTFNPRLQWQRQWTPRENRTDIVNKLRTKLGINYNIRSWKLDPLFAAELFFREGEESYASEKVRLTLGTKFKIKKGLSMGWAYRHELPISDDADTLSILQAMLSYRF